MKYIAWKRAVGAMLILCMLSVTTSYAKTTQDNLDDAREQIDDLEDQKNEAEEQVHNISDKKQGFESKLGELNGQLTDIVASMNDLETQISEKESEITLATEELDEAQERLAKQYEDMKLRIQFMYENGGASAWEMLLESASFGDFLNRTEYISKINQYDRQKLVEFQELQEEIAGKKADLEGDMEDLVALKGKMQERQNNVNSLIGTTKSNIAQASEDLVNAQASVDDISERLQQMLEYERQLEIQKAKEDAARLEAIKQQEQEDTSGVIYVPADSDAYLLGAIIQCEAEGEPYEGKLAVGSVVLNRVKSSYFPNTITGVIYQKNQFSPVASGRLAYRLQAGVNDSCLKAAQEVLGGNITLSSLYFRTNNGIIQGTVIGHHVFY